MNSPVNPIPAPDISILMPVYNEIDSIAEIVGIVTASLPGVLKEIVIVDDGSNDGTRAWLAEKFPIVIEGDGTGDPAASVDGVGAFIDADAGQRHGSLQVPERQPDIAERPVAEVLERLLSVGKNDLVGITQI